MDAQTEAAREGLHQPLRHVAALRQPLVRLADPWANDEGEKGEGGMEITEKNVDFINMDLYGFDMD